MKRLLICLLIMLSASLLIAVQVDTNQALKIASGFIASRNGSECPIKSTDVFLAENHTDPDLYIVRFAPGGFVLVAGDTRSYPILGFSQNETFPEGDLPAHVQWYLKQYSLSMSEIRQHPEWQDDPLWQLMDTGNYSSWQFDRDVAPILTTTWNQDWPYNSMCPGDTQGPGGHVYAGCVATAMAQVMKRWNYPITGSGSHSYNATGYGTQSANFGATTYNWSSMPNSTASVNTAISTLIYHCGVAVDMQYAPDGSGAYSDDARNALVNYFRYNSSAQLLAAASYSATTWATMIRGDLDLGRPVYYAGQGAEGGHAFVLDGYQGTNYFHFNWGWSGSYNGYFYLSNLNPGSHSFSQNQRAMLYVYPLNTTTNDLAATSLTGPTAIQMYQASTFTATVSNAGTASQSTYTVKLMRDAGVQLASITGNTIAPGATQTYQLSWAPTVTGTYSLYAQVSLSTDTNAANNQSPTLSVSVSQPAVYDPPTGVNASISGSSAVITWIAPGAGTGQWIHYDSGLNSDTIGTSSAADFDIAIRYPGSTLTAYAGMSLRAVKVWPAQTGTYAARVWTGGTPIIPGTMVVDQTFTPVLDTYNTIILANPVPINTSQELWFGMRCVVSTGYPAGCDAGPAVDGFGNMIYFNGVWSTLLALSSSLDYNWNIQGYVGYSAPTNAPLIAGTKYVPFPALNDPAPRVCSGMLQLNPVPGNGGSLRDEPSRVLNGYKVWRLTNGNQNIEANWTALTPSIITSLSYTDTSWQSLPSGSYLWAVKAVYDATNYSVAAFSNVVVTSTTGTIAGVVRNQQNQAISGATISCSTYSTTSNAAGAYSFSLPTGTYSVIASHPSYAASTQSNVVVQSGQTTTVNFVLQPISNVVNDSFETYADFATTFAPWTCVDVDQSGTYTMTNVGWPGAGNSMAYMVFNPASTTPPITTFTAHTGAKLAVAIASTVPPNNDWLISPLVSNPVQFRFWARSLTSQYGLERFKVGVSTTGTNPASFTIISGASYLQAPVEWTEYTYDVSGYDGNVYLGIQCISNDAWFFMVDDAVITSDGSSPDPFGNPTILPSSMAVVAGVTINSQQASNGDVLAAYVTENGTPQLRGKATVQVIDGIAGCNLQVYTTTNGETLSFRVWDQSTNTIYYSPTTLHTTVNGTVGSWPSNLFMVNATSGMTQDIAFTSGWNLISLNVSPENNYIATLCAPIMAQLQQIKGTDGIYIPGNPYSTLAYLNDGKAYNFQMGNPIAWSVVGSEIPSSMPIPLADGWNIAAFLPQASMPVSSAMASIATWLQQIKGTDGIYIPNNPYSTLTTMYPGKGYWIKLTGAHNLIYSTRGELPHLISDNISQPGNMLVRKPASAVALVRCDGAKPGDVLQAWGQGELRGSQQFVAPEGFPAALVQIYCDSAELVSFSLLQADGREIPLSTKLTIEPDATYGSYPDFISLEFAASSGEDVLAQPPLLQGSYPNPFSSLTHINFSTGKETSNLTLEIYNLKGQLVRHLTQGSFAKGDHSVLWDGRDDSGRPVSSGVYIATLVAPGIRQQHKMLITK